MPHVDVTLDAQAEIITHWIIRSLLGETLDMRAVSSDYSVARAQHYHGNQFLDFLENLSELSGRFATLSACNRCPLCSVPQFAV